MQSDHIDPSPLGVMDIWKTIPGISPSYKVSRAGQVARFKPDGTFKLLNVYSQPVNNRGYPRKPYFFVAFKNYGKESRYYIHRLVAQAYIPNPRNLPQVNHIDGDKANNNVENLEWLTHSQNSQHASVNGLYSHGENQYNSKVTEEHVKAIRHLYAHGWSQFQLEKIFPIAQTTIGQITRRKTWKHLK